MAFGADRAAKVQADLMDIGHECTITSTLSTAAEDRGISIYPKPASDQVHLQMAPSIHIVRGQLIDMNSKMVKQWLNQVSAINISTLPVGLYTIDSKNKTLRLITQSLRAVSYRY